MFLGINGGDDEPRTTLEVLSSICPGTFAFIVFLWHSYFQFPTFQGSSELEENEGGAVRDFLEDYSKISDWLNSVQAERSRFVDGFMLSQLVSLKLQPTNFL